MPRILITGLPNRLQESDTLRQLLVNDIPLSVERTPGFAITANSVFAHAVPDLVDERPARVVTFTVEGLLEKSDRTAPMRLALCEAISDTLSAFLVRMEIPYASVLGWCVRIDREEDGFIRHLSAEA